MLKRDGFTWIELLAGLLLACIIAGVVIPSYVRMKEKAKESEVKSGLHEIQLSVERFSIDNEGSYPPYLIGGSAGPQITESTSDPLLRGGYLNMYPTNPFAKGQRADAAFTAPQARVPSSTVYGNDPLRPGTPESVNGLRFGVGGAQMGSVLADPRHRTRTYLDQATGRTETRQTYADVEYDYWDMFAPLHQKSFLPGEFFYKSIGPIIAGPESDTSRASDILPAKVDNYLLGAYGSVRTRGNDWLGSEPLVHFTFDLHGQHKPMDFCPWTRSQVRGNDAREGSPFGEVPANSESYDQVELTNSNGVPDGLLLVLTWECRG